MGSIKAKKFFNIFLQVELLWKKVNLLTSVEFDKKIGFFKKKFKNY